MKDSEIFQTLNPAGFGYRKTLVTTSFHFLQLQDPHQNRIGQWLDVRPKQGMADLSFPLASEVSVGTYTINVANPKVSGTFQVEEHGKMQYREQGTVWKKCLFLSV